MLIDVHCTLLGTSVHTITRQAPLVPLLEVQRGYFFIHIVPLYSIEEVYEHWVISSDYCKSLTLY